MKLITLIWRERGYSCPFYATAEAPAGAALAEARRLVREARAKARADGADRIFRLRARISAL